MHLTAQLLATTSDAKVVLSPWRSTATMTRRLHRQERGSPHPLHQRRDISIRYVPPSPITPGHILCPLNLGARKDGLSKRLSGDDVNDGDANLLVANVHLAHWGCRKPINIVLPPVAAS